jgi:hypothetical protein
MHRTSLLGALVGVAAATMAYAGDATDAAKSAPATAPATSTATTPAPATASAPTDSTAAPRTANGKVVLRENLYYYDAFNRRDPFRSLVDGAFNRNDKMDLVNLSAVQLVGIVRGEVDRFALLEDASGYSYILRVGDRVHNGTVVSIGEDELVARVTNFGQTTTVRLHLVGR